MALRGRTPHTLPLLQHEGSSHGTQFSTNFSNVSPSQGLHSSQIAPAWVLPTGCHPSGTGCHSVGPPWGRKPCQQTCSSVGFSLHGSAGPSRSLLQCGAPHGVTASFRHPPAQGWGPFHRLQVDICSTVELHRLQGNSMPHDGLHHELQGKVLCSNISGTSCPLLLH